MDQIRISVVTFLWCNLWVYFGVFFGPWPIFEDQKLPHLHEPLPLESKMLCYETIFVLQKQPSIFQNFVTYNHIFLLTDMLTFSVFQNQQKLPPNVNVKEVFKKYQILHFDTKMEGWFHS